jgi:mono/diheme cytochrome c family protein
MRTAAQQTKTADGAYSDAQASRGEALYAKYCRSCHGPQLAGTEFAPGITGAEFKTRWQARSARDLLDVVHTTMPLNSPAGLIPQQSADVTAFILKKAGFAAGTADLAAAVAAATGAAAPDRSGGAAVRRTGWYTEEQAARGKVLFYRHCAMCHTSGDPAMEKTDAQPERGWRMGDRTNMRNLPIRYYPTVYHLFERIRDFMPGWDIDGATPSEKIDIVAYLLKTNKFPPGSAELSLDVAAMKKMPIATVAPDAPEEGFEPLVVGSTTPGLKNVFGFSCAPQPGGCGRTDGAGVLKVENGVITAEGRYHGMIYTEKKYRDFDLRFDYRWIPPADMDPDDDFPSVSSGYLLFIDQPSVWPTCIEIEGNEVHPMAPYAMGGTAKSTYDEKLAHSYRKAGGHWNQVRIVSSGGDVKVFLNGALISHITEHTFPPGHIGFQYQGGKIEWRRIRIKG